MKAGWSYKIELRRRTRRVLRLYNKLPSPAPLVFASVNLLILCISALMLTPAML